MSRTGGVINDPRLIQLPLVVLVEVVGVLARPLAAGPALAVVAARARAPGALPVRAAAVAVVARALPAARVAPRATARVLALGGVVVVVVGLVPFPLPFASVPAILPAVLGTLASVPFTILALRAVGSLAPIVPLVAPLALMRVIRAVIALGAGARVRGGLAAAAATTLDGVVHRLEGALVVGDGRGRGGGRDGDGRHEDEDSGELHLGEFFFFAKRR